MSDYSSSGFPPAGDSQNSSSQTGWPVVWLTSHETLPNQCITCGMFTDVRKAAKISSHETKYVTQKGSSGVEAVGCFLHLLGPIGFLISLALQGAQKDETVEKVVKVKSKIKLPVCRLCASQKVPDPIQGNSTTGRYAFEVHPRFAEELHKFRLQRESL